VIPNGSVYAAYDAAQDEKITRRPVIMSTKIFKKCELLPVSCTKHKKGSIPERKRAKGILNPYWLRVESLRVQEGCASIKSVQRVVQRWLSPCATRKVSGVPQQKHANVVLFFASATEVYFFSLME
jgi:hypothetical protein